MTVQKLIEELSKVKNKNREIGFWGYRDCEYVVTGVDEETGGDLVRLDGEMLDDEDE